MSYASDDPRASLATGTLTRPSSSDAVAAPEFLDFSLMPPDVTTEAGSVRWIVRGQNFVIIHTHPVAGDELWRATLRSEQVLLLIDGTSSIRGTASADPEGASPHEVTGPALVVVPPGESEIHASGPGAIVQLIQSDEVEWADQASNADHYTEPHPQVAPLDPWPMPVDGYRWRTYLMSDVPAQDGRFGRLFRTRSFMVNFLKAGNAPRPLAKMSPHFHADFEQASLVVAGSYIHHIQTPWGTDGTAWRPEDHARVGSPSVTIIPPPTIHTSQAIDGSKNHLIDIFAGPRADFSAQPGWVLNAAEYPLPDERTTEVVTSRGTEGEVTSP